jgi:Flp pilus assembly protein TadG
MLKAIKNEKGFSLVMLALSVVVLFGFGALAIDVGHLYQVKDQLQVAADAAALAGAAKLDGTSDPAQTAARSEAQRIAALNFADVATTAVPAYGQSHGAAVGSPIPVALKLPQSSGDIIVGNWDGTTFTPADGTVTINAVEVNARRLGAIDAQPESENWFSKIFTLLGGNYDFSGITAVAIAAKIQKIPFVPISVNEYWDESVDKNGNPANNSGQAYGQQYPESFMRSVNADGSSGTTIGTRALGGKTFAIIGTNANGNQSSFNINSFVDVLLRSKYHDGTVSDSSGPAWFEVRTDSTTGTCSPSCDNNLTPLPPTVNSGDVNPGKYDENFSYLFDGIPDNVIPPNAVREIIRTSPRYTFDNYNTANRNDPSQCPYATVPYFDSSGSGPTSKKFQTSDSLNGVRFWQQYPKGSKMVVMVYDGTHVKGSANNVADAVTVVGYGIIEIDGYANGNFNGDPSTLDPGGPGGKGGGTAYGHAVPHGLGGDDLYLIQPSDSDRAPDCSFTDRLKALINNTGGVGAAKLVGPNLKYGVINH